MEPARATSLPDNGGVTLWGSINGTLVRLYTLENERGLRLRVTSYGAAITELLVPDRDGRLADVALGYDTIDAYVAFSPYFGAVAGRNANRIDQGSFVLDSNVHQLAKNDGPHHLHGGKRGFDKRVWSGGFAETSNGASVRFSRESPAGEENYPGTLRATVTYSLTNENEFITEFEASTDAPTLCNMAQHTYWNLAGHDAGTILEHSLTLHADAYTPVSESLIPTGEIASVEGTAFDFRAPKRIGRDLAAVGVALGYDHNFVVRGEPQALRPVARLHDPASGRVMELRADQPGVQFYSGNLLDGTLVGKGGAVYERYAGLCLESQLFPNAINEPGWMQPVLRPGDVYRHTMITRFTTDAEGPA